MKSLSISENRCTGTTILSVVKTVLFSCLNSTVGVTTLGVGGLVYSSQSSALSCGSYNGTICNGTATQYAGGFNPRAGESGGFGGAASCTVTHTPVVFVHGNGDNSTSWDSPTFQVSGYVQAPNSVYQQFKAAGYKDCELFGVTYLSASERNLPQSNYHRESKYAIIDNFIMAVKLYTGQAKVDLVTHSMGVSMSMAALDYYSDWSSVRRFVNIAGGLHGLDSCLWTGYANANATTCGSQNWYDTWIFGVYPDAASPGINSWTGTSVARALPNTANSNTAVAFYTIYAGTNDEIMCATTSDYANCGNSPLLRNTSHNVKAQLNVGAGSNTQQVNWDWTTGIPSNVVGGDVDGVGHFHSRNNTGTIIVNMLTTACTDAACAVGYSYGPIR